MKIVVDTNILWVSLSKKSNSHWIFNELTSGSFTLCVTSEILQEYEEIISQKLGFNTAQMVMKLMENLSTINYITTYFRWQLIKQDISDNKFVDCAIACNADYLATNDKHFDILKQINFPKVNVINSKEFKKVFYQTKIN